MTRGKIFEKSCTRSRGRSGQFLLQIYFIHVSALKIILSVTKLKYIENFSSYFSVYATKFVLHRIASKFKGGMV